MRKRSIILILILLWEIEYLPVPVYFRSVNVWVQHLTSPIQFCVIIAGIVLSVKWLKIRSLLMIPFLLFVMFLDLVVGDIKRDLCNRVIVYSNHFFTPQQAFNPILGVVMNKHVDTAIYSWGFFFPETAEELYYVPSHNMQSSSDRESVEVINKDWYCIKFDVEF